MSRTTGIVSPSSGVKNPRSARAADDKLVLWTDKGEPRIVKPLSLENKKLLVDAESMLSLGARAELELPPLSDDEVRLRVRVEVVYSNPGKGSTTLKRGMQLAFPALDDALFDRLQGIVDRAPGTGPVGEAPDKGKRAKDEDTVLSKAPVGEAAVGGGVAARAAAEPTRRTQELRAEPIRRPRRVKSYLGVLVLAVLPLVGYLAYLGYQDYLDRQSEAPQSRPAIPPPSRPVKPPPKNPNNTTPVGVVDARYVAYLAPAREAAQALRIGDAPMLEAKLAVAEKAIAGIQGDPASLVGLRAGRLALRLRDTAMDGIGQVRSLEGKQWGPGSNTPYRTKQSFLKAQEARISMTKSGSVELADAILAILGAPEPAKAEGDSSLQARIDQISRMLEVSQ